MIGYVKISNPPITCSQCPVRYYGPTGALHSDMECDLWHHVVDIMRYRHAKCPIILASDNHGRLGDLDHLQKRIQEEGINQAEQIADRNHPIVMAYADCYGKCKDEMTVIPAVGDDTHE